MKNKKKTYKHDNHSIAEKSSHVPSRRSIPVILIGINLISVMLTGCLDPLPQQTVYSETINTIEEIYADNEVGGTGLPFGVTLQVDPSVLVPCDLERVVDGDTIIVHNPDGDRLRVRLTGINAPESVHEDESKNTEEGREASQFMKDLLEHVDVVYLEYDEAEFDQYDRTLAYVWIDTGDTYVMVNEIMLATDHAEPVYIKPNLRYADTFRQYEG